MSKITAKTTIKIKKKTTKSTKTTQKTTASTNKKTTVKTTVKTKQKTTTTKLTTSSSINETDIALELLKKQQVQEYMDSVNRRLKNFERLMNLKMDTFWIREKISSVDVKPRLVFLMTYEDLVKMYEEKQKKTQTMKQITSGFKLTATIALLSSCIFLVYSLYHFKINMEQRYKKKKAAKEKRKRRAKKKKKRRQVLSKL